MKVAVETAHGVSVPGEPLLPHEPTVIGPYVLMSRLGVGGMGAVYYARDQQGRPVAVKVIRSDRARDQEFRRRFRWEVEAARSVASFCTAEVLDADPDAFAPYLVTEFIDGPRLDNAVADGGPLDSSTLTGLAVGVATALTAIHHAGLVHRDLKPSNVILSLTGPRVIDFGIARARDGAGKPTAWGFGSAGWMAPEQINGQPIGAAADVFAWGILVAYAGTGRHPFGDGPDVELSHRITAAEPDLTGLPGQVVDLVRDALTKDAAGRPDARDLLLRLVERRPGEHSTDPAVRLLGLTAELARSPDRSADRSADARRRLRGRGRVLLTVSLVLVMVALTAIRLAANRDDGTSAEPATPAATPVESPATSATPATSVASPAVPADSSAMPLSGPRTAPGPGAFQDGPLSFAVDGVECGVEQLGLGFLARHPAGQFCLVAITIRNTGTSPRALDSSYQYVYDSTGARRTADYLSRYYLPGETIWNTAEPGASIHGRMVFDLPPDATPRRLELHDSPASGGGSIPL
ncbi:serine/threonine protein kinase [Frankia sp. CcI49]|uniref:serine/threonine-protein kinase n=1 Tax=Frankia sp. CcI49 TaxID=1745382 RepID=UPI000975488E|nr:serine/threonine-protein kinase [Frankia sp. CcI49]ONH52054.1 serine/threonine protein kinase [Frankia sp. CcI49]